MLSIGKKRNFESTGGFAHMTEFLTLGMALLIILLLYLLMLIMQISTLSGNHKDRKSLATKKTIVFKKMSLNFKTFFAI